MQTNLLPRGDVEIISLHGQDVTCRFFSSKTAKRIRIKVKSDGIDVVVPHTRDLQEGVHFLNKNEEWVAKQIERVHDLSLLRRPRHKTRGKLLFKGELVSIHLVQNKAWRAPNRVSLQNEELTITCGTNNVKRAEKTLENWLRKEARRIIESHVTELSSKLKRIPNRIYIMGQKTKWGNCSSLENLSFNWRLVMAPDYVLRYIVTHEMVHLAIPDHSQKFWLTVQSLCHNTEKARQWLIANQDRLRANLSETLR